MSEESGSALKKIFQTFSLKQNDTLKALAELRGNQRVTDQKPRGQISRRSKKYGRDLTAMARAIRENRSGHPGRDTRKSAMSCRY